MPPHTGKGSEKVVNDVQVALLDLKGGEHIQTGDHVFQYQIDARSDPSAKH